jgi:hypothetical protein
MSIEVTVILDSGCFLPSEKKEGLAPGRYYANIGYFQNPKGCADIRVLVDDDERVFDPCLELEENNDTIEVRLVHNGTVNREGVTAAKTFHDKLLHLKDLYGDHVEMDPKKFDCIIRFESGRFMPSMVKGRAFKESRRDTVGTAFATTGKRKEIAEISHNIAVHFTLEKGDTLELARNGKVFLSSRDLGVKNRLAIELPVSNVVGNKFYHDAFKTPRPDSVYWLPNECDPPPNCPNPPCGDPGGG